jgi:hypothetical protein
MKEEFNAMRAAYESKLRAARGQMQAFEKDRATEVKGVLQSSEKQRYALEMRVQVLHSQVKSLRKENGV